MLQQSLFMPDSAWRAPRLSDLPADWNAVTRIGLDTETKDPLIKKLGPGVRRGAQIVGISFCLEGDRPYYLPIRHLGGDNCAEGPEAVLNYVRDQASRFTGDIVGAKISYDIDFLAEEGIHFPHATFRDVQVAEALIDELQMSYSLDSILARRGLALKEEDLLREAAGHYKGSDGKPLDPKRDLWMLPARYVGPYAEADAVRPLDLLRKQEAEIETVGLGRIWALETKVLPVLVKMRRRGVRVNMDRLDQIERFSQAEERKVWSEVLRLTGVMVKVGDAMKADVLAGVLQAADVRYGLTAKGKPSITKEFLEALDHPVGKLLRRARKMSQLRSTFVNSIRNHAIDHGDEHRIHCTFNQTVVQDDDDELEGARPGRLSCVDPNLQQQPARDPEIGPMWRAIYEPDKGALWASLDYSQQEPRLAVHTAVISGVGRIGSAAHESALAAAQRYWDDRSTDAHTMFTQMVFGEDVINEDKKSFKVKRDRCKNIFLGLCYGMGGPKLCRSLGLPVDVIRDARSGTMREVAGKEGQALFDLVNQRVPYIKATAKAVEQAAKAKGYIVTVMGRHCHFPKDQFGNYDWTHKAFNRAIQGGAADQTKAAMVALDEAGAYLQLQVHDEFDESIESRAQGEMHAEIMENCVPLKVPSKVDLEIGPNWGEAK